MYALFRSLVYRKNGNMEKFLRPSARIDTMGNVIQEEMSVLTMNCVGLIPHLIADNQRLRARLEQMREKIAACCVARDGTRTLTNVTAPGANFETDLRIVRNPVADQTELRYTIGTAGRVRLEIMDASGRAIRTQDEGARSTGTSSFGRSTTLLSPGTNYCTLFVNDEPLVKKAVKLNAR